jgi:cytochrome c-type biogenesis protein CcmH
MTLWFLAAAAAMAGAAMLFVLGGLRRARAPARRRSDEQANALVLRDRLDELRREHAQGLSDGREFAVAQEELQRRLLAEAVAAQPPAAAAAPGSRAALFAVAGVLPAGALALYLIFGSPHLLSPPASGPSSVVRSDDAEADRPSAALLAQLEAHVAAVPKDARAWVLLARARMESGLFAPAAAAYERAFDAQPRVARDPRLWCELADALGMSQGGSLAGRPRDLIERALAADPAAPCALEMAGSAAVEARDFHAARDHWRRLLVQLPADSPQHVQLATALERIEQQARLALPQRAEPAVRGGLPLRNSAAPRP